MGEKIDYTQRLKALMDRADITSYRMLAQQAKVSRWQIQQLRGGRAQMMRIAALTQLSNALQISLSSLLNKFGVEDEFSVEDKFGIENKLGAKAQEREQSEALGAASKSNEVSAQVARAEYERLQAQAAQQLEAAHLRFQAESLQAIETWLVQWPTIAQRAKERGAELPAVKILPFIRPIETLMAAWGVEAIAPVNAQVPYDPHYHQLTGAGAAPGEIVTVTHSGALHNGKLLHRAKVKK